jgi:hypothetical protein
MALTPMRTPTTMPNILKKVSQPDASAQQQNRKRGVSFQAGERRVAASGRGGSVPGEMALQSEPL